MKRLLTMMVLLLTSSIALPCQKGFKPTDVPGVCIEVNQDEATNPWRSDELPPKDKMPSYQREGIEIVNAPSMAEADAKADAEKVTADREGKRTAGIGK